MNPVLVTALLQWLAAGLPQFITAVQNHAPDLMAPPPTVDTIPDTNPMHPLGFPPVEPSQMPEQPPEQMPEQPAALNAGGNDVIRIVQCLLGVAEDGYWGPATRNAVLALKAKLGLR